VGTTTWREIDAVTAHGLLNVAAIVDAAATELLAEDVTTGEGAARLLRLLVRNTELLGGPDAGCVGDRRVGVEDRSTVLEGVRRAVSTVRRGLEAVVRGLPPELHSFLDELAVGRPVPAGTLPDTPAEPR
jgi:hypothetical protein